MSIRTNIWLKVAYAICGVIAFLVIFCILRFCAFSAASAEGMGIAVMVGISLSAWTDSVTRIFLVAVILGLAEFIVADMFSTILYPWLLGILALTLTFLFAFFFPLLGEGKSRIKRAVSILCRKLILLGKSVLHVRTRKFARH